MRDRFFFSLSLVWIIAFSILSTILLSIPLFSLDIGWENLTEVSGLSHAALMENYYVLMNYLMNPFQAELNLPDFPSSATALEHFAQVKWLFLLVIALVFGLFYFFWKFVKESLYILFHQGVFLAMVVPMALAIFAVLVGFDSFFVFFHQVLFRDSSWLFDPTTDPIINVLTENFFMYCFIIFALVYELLLLIFLLKGKMRKR